MNNSGDKNTAFSRTRSLQCGDKNIALAEPVLMGILNLTPDSFYDGGFYQLEEQYIRRAEQMLEEGASIIDLGAVSTRPGAAAVSEQEELQRLIPAVKTLSLKFPDAVLSIDTYRSSVAEIAFNNGAGIINDISGGNLDRNMFHTIANLNIPYILMHMKGLPSTMQINPEYGNVVADIREFFTRKLKELEENGVKQVIIDPGFGFGKTIEHNFTLLNHLSVFKEFSYPIMVGVSRKSMINRLLNIKPEEALHATGVMHALSLLQGADILRVHDVKEAAQVIKIVKAFRQVAE